jgi:hypothetical protein
VGTTTFTITATDAAGNTASCTQQVVVTDNEAPSIVCPTLITANVDAGLCTASGITLTAPTVTDNCAILSTTNNAPATFPVGISTFTYTVTDVNSNTATCVQQVLVIDNIAPNVVCNADTTIYTSSTTCDATVSLPSTITSDNCGVDKLTYTITGATTTSDSGNVINVTFEKGSSIVTYYVTDVNGNTNNCSFTVTVQDTNKAVIVCPANVTLPINFACSRQVNNIGLVNAADNCGNVSITYKITGTTMGAGSNNASGTVFNKGLSTVTYFVEDAEGNIDSCSFTVTIIDNIKPIPTCPPTQTLFLDPAAIGCTYPLPNFVPASSATDNCDVLGNGITLSQYPVAGTSLSGTGTEPIWIIATDASGNIDSCQFLINKVNSNPPLLNCISNKTIIAGANCSAVLPDYTSTVISADICIGAAGTTITQSPQAGSILSGLSPVTILTITATDASNNTATCTATITLKDTTKPNITCPSTQTLSLSATCDTVLPDYTSLVTANDDCTPSSTNIVINQTPAPGSFVAGVDTLVINITATDSSGNVSTCSFNVHTKDVTAPIITCPANVTASSTSNSCTAVGVALGTPIATDGCGIATITNNAPAIYNAGTTVVTYTVTDINGLTNTCTQNVLVADSTAPTITCPGNIIYTNALNACYSAVNNSVPVFADNCGVLSLTYDITGASVQASATTGINNTNGYLFNVGTSTVAYTVIDTNGKSASCSFTVTINDTTKPSIVCAPDVTDVAAAGVCQSAPIALTFPTANDNCGIATTFNNAQLTYSVGTTNITWTTTDIHGNTNFCIQKVIITDAEVPVITCAADTTINATATNCVANSVMLAMPIATDNCGVQGITYLPINLNYTVGFTDVVYTVTDIHGNQNSCTRRVNVLCTDTIAVEPPCPTCPVVACPDPTKIDTTGGFTASTCGGSTSLVVTGPDVNGCYTYTPVGQQDAQPDTSCIVICANGVCDTTVVIIKPNYTTTPDAAVTYAGTPVNGNASSNDNVPSNASYISPQPSANNPSTDVPSVNANGIYTFNSTTAGEYNFVLPIVLPNGDTLLSDLKITVLPVQTIANMPPFANPDVASTLQGNAVTINTLGNDGAAPGGSPIDVTSVTITSAPANGTTSINAATGAIIYTPNGSFTGNDTLTYTVKDANGNTATAKQYITVLPINAGNTTQAADDYISTAHQVPVSGNVLNNDTDPQGNIQSVVASTINIPNKGQLVLSANGAYTFTPAPGFIGPVSFNYCAYDNGSPTDSSKATLTILVGPPAPIAVPDNGVTYQGAPATGNVSTNDKNMPTGSVYYTPPVNTNNPSADVPSVNPDGTYTFTSIIPGEYTFQIPIVSPAGDTIYSEIKVTVIPVNKIVNVPPVANNDLATTQYNTPTTIQPLLNDGNAPGGAPLNIGSLQIISGPANGAAIANNLTGEVDYTPTAGFVGVDTIRYTVTDTNGLTATALMVIEVLAPNAKNTTTASDDYTSAPNNTPATGNVLANDVDAEADAQSAIVQNISIPGKGQFVLDASGNYTFTPLPSFSGSVDVVYSIVDNDANPANATATIHIVIANPIPAPVLDYNVVTQDSSLVGNVATNDNNIPAGTIYNTPQPNASNPSTSVPTVAANGTYTFTTAIPGVYNFKVPIVLSSGDTMYSDLQITVVPNNPIAPIPPIANPDYVSTLQGNAVTIATLANDGVVPGGAAILPSSVTVLTLPLNGITSINSATGDITYTPNAGFVGTDELVYQITDANGQTATAKQVINVAPVNAPNTTDAADDFASTPYQTNTQGNVLKNDTDKEGDVQKAITQNINIPGKGTFVLSSNGKYVFTPAPGFSGSVDIPYTVYDNNINVDSAKATIHILVGKPAPQPLPESNVILEDDTATGNLSTNDVYMPTGTTYNTPAANPSNPSADVPTVNTDGTYTFTSTTPGSYNFNIPIVTPSGDTIYSMLSITVLPVNTPSKPPYANTDVAATLFNVPVTINTLANDGAYPGGSPLDNSSVTITKPASNGIATVNTATGEITYTPNGGFTGMDTIMYLVKDMAGNIATAMQVINVIAPNAKNTTLAADDFATTTDSQPTTGNVLANDTDAQGDAQSTVANTITNASGTFIIDANGNYTFTPAPGFSGTVQFPITVFDNNAEPDTAYSSINILVVPPVFVPMPDVNFTWINIPVSGNLSINDVNGSSNNIYLNGVANASNPSGGILTILPDGIYTFTATSAGTYIYNVPIVLENGDTVYSSLQITVVDSNITIINKPIANPDVVSMPLNSTVTINTLANDGTVNFGYGVGLNPSTVTVSDAPRFGTATVDAITGNIIYTPNTGFVGTDTLQYSVTDSLGGTATAYQYITVIDTSNAPNNTTAADDFATVVSIAPVSGNVLANDTDPQGDAVSVAPQNINTAGIGNLQLNSDGSYTFTPVPGYVGVISYPYTVTDARGASATGILYFIIKSLNAPLNIAQLTLSGKRVQLSNVLTWQAFNEQDVNYYQLYSYTNNIADAQLVATINGIGNGNNEYSITDDNVLINKYYYVQAIKDNAVAITSNTILVSVANDKLVLLYPNPTSDMATLQFNTSIANKATVKLFDNAGKLIHIIYTNTQVGTNTVDINVAHLANGSYFVKLIIDGQKDVTLKLIKQ